MSLYLVYALRTACFLYAFPAFRFFFASVQGEFNWELLELNYDITQLELKVASNVEGELVCLAYSAFRIILNLH